MASKKVPSAGVRLTKAVPGKPFKGAGVKGPFPGMIGGTGNATKPKSYPKGK
jgi:hypothetical protein